MEDQNAGSDMGVRLRRLLRVRGESLKSFAERSGVPYRTLQNHVAGKIKPNADQLAKMSDAGVDLNFLLTGKHLRPGDIMPDVNAGMGEEGYYIQSDAEIRNAIDKKAKQAIDFFIRYLVREGREVHFDNLLTYYVIVVRGLMKTFLKAEPPIAEARRLGMPVEKLVDAILDLSLRALEQELVALAQKGGAQEQEQSG